MYNGGETIQNYVSRMEQLQQQELSKLDTARWSRIRNIDNKRFMNMTFPKILIYGKNKVTKKDLYFKNYINIKNIIVYINNYSAKNNGPTVGLRKIKKLVTQKLVRGSGRGARLSVRGWSWRSCRGGGHHQPV